MSILKQTGWLFAAFLLASCQTKYQDGDWTGGVRALQVTSDTYRISASGNGYTSQSTIQDYVLLKAAETAIQRGYSHFAVIDSTDTTRNETGQTSTTANVIGGTVFVNPGTTYEIVKPGKDTVIRLVNFEEGQAVMPGLYNAREVYSFINPRVARPKSKKA